MENLSLRDYGRLIKDGELKMRSHEDGSRQKLRYVFIFNRGVIFCKTTRVRIRFIINFLIFFADFLLLLITNISQLKLII